MSSFALLEQYYPWLPLVMLTLLGLLVGSFLNVVIHRLPIMMERSWQQEYRDYFDESSSDEEQSTAAPERFNLMVPRSACPHCGHAITALENIPILSWLMLRGRCRGCQARISARYPLVELCTGLATLAIAWHFPLGSSLLITLVGLFLTVLLNFYLYTVVEKGFFPDQDTGMLKEAGAALQRQIDEVIIPELDIYRLAKIALTLILYKILKHPQ